jgi:hypothetical protein
MMVGPNPLPNRTDSHLAPFFEPSQIKRGGGGGKGGNAEHFTPVDVLTVRQRSVTPPSYGLTVYLRRFFENVAGLAMFATPSDNLDWTNNQIDRTDRPASPIPWGRKWRISTFHPRFDQRLWTVYWPKEAFQFVSRNYTANTLQAQEKIRGSYFPMLTQYRRYPPYSDSTHTLGGS